ncbi:TPA: TcpQ domain-containing protein [Stenotrophomonas maltophilia]|uniref:TcpQ domain-containing protein n=3 Tax=Pseudomonadota TaxID=1224 RepID=UPI000C14FF9B|nr:MULTISPECIES: TcpQ domain-containing protein [Gammaproteobacteria]MCR1805626.1 toxin co-regulated pilus biosynthesis Q family protein [Stenotrophomonas geniculata]EKU9962840.1 TcpQ domain-containing protein [Stenotrophomonas maltophilia]MCU1142261.1 TcpQ domain-containing protein [Stenotrophomonas maltophilia]MDA5338885.1 toxin co-regulated pilus biosynthesis Q family protein [Stenotrophomonas maltophilia]UXF78811.1 toxin co-regulated pilus biosynthesis Q family protein [Stenotrophomonas ma
MSTRTTKRAVVAALAVSFLQAAGASAADAPVVAKSKGFTVVENASYTRPAPPPPPRPAERRYDVPAETPLRQVLQGWAAAEGWAVYWPTAADGSEWVTEIAVSYTATDFQQAVTKLMGALPGKVGLAATFNRANSPMLVHVSESSSMQEIP